MYVNVYGEYAVVFGSILRYMESIEALPYMKNMTKYVLFAVHEIVSEYAKHLNLFGEYEESI
jgi:hypothetical protein